jgi:hypothetical protein
MQQRPPSFGLNLAGLSPAMNAVAATLFWSQLGQPPLNDKNSKQASFVLNSAGLIPAMNAAAATLFWARFQRPHTYSGQPQNSLFWSQFGRLQYTFFLHICTFYIISFLKDIWAKNYFLGLVVF